MGGRARAAEGEHHADYRRLPARVFLAEFFFFYRKFFACQMGRHTDAPVFGKGTVHKTTLRFTGMACAIGVSIAVMVDLREIPLSGAGESFVP